MVKKTFLLFLLFTSILSASAQKEVYLFTSFHEPATDGLRFLYSYDGYHWTDLGRTFLKPEVGKQKVLRDPSIVQGPDGTFHLVWTSSWRGDLGFGYASSRDLVHWSGQKFIPVMAYDTTTVNVWAPEVFFDDETQQFIIVWASCIPFKFPRGQEDENNNHRLYYTTTKDFMTFAKTKLFCDPGFSAIDAVVVKQDKGKYVLVVKDNTRPNRNIKVAFSNKATGPYTNVSEPFTRTFCEGPTVAKVGNDWLIYYDAYRDKKYGASKTTDFKTFTEIWDQVSVPEGHKHGTIFKVKEEILNGMIEKVKDEKHSQTIQYTGNTLVNVDYHHGQLSPVVGVHNIQVFRANREHPEMAEGSGWTYNHAPMLAYWNGSFYLEYLSDSVSESVAPGQTLLLTSKDGYNWGKPTIIFPRYKIPDGTEKETEKDGKLVAHNLYSVMHQRMGFYVSKKNRLLVLAYYGISMNDKDAPNDGKGIGRVVREAYPDGHFGPIYFIHYNSAWNEKNTSYPYYTTSKDKGFIEACKELMAKPLMMQQWNEESDKSDPLIPITKDYKAFCYYHLSDGRVVGLWKYALTSISNDEGKTWPTPVRAPKFVNANAKIWGQRTSDGRYATVYNPSEFRWPLALSVSENGLDYTNLLLVQGEISTMRYGGRFKSWGPQYVRGIIEGNGTPPDGNMWLTYSMNKEDIWVAEVPVPIKDKVEGQVNDVFDQMSAGEELKSWNIYSPLWAPVKIEKMKDGARCLALKDWDKFDFAKAERVFPASKKLAVEFSMAAAQSDNGLLHVELQNAKGTAAIRLVFDSTGICKAKSGYRFSKVIKYKAGESYDFRITFDTDTRFYTVKVNGKDAMHGLFFAPVDSLERIVFRTGEPRHFPNAESPSEQTFDMPDAGGRDSEAAFYIKSFKTMTP